MQSVISARQFRKAGPMLLSNPTNEDLEQLREIRGNIQYLAFYRVDDCFDYHVFAHSSAKLTPLLWREALRVDVSNVVPCENIKEALADLRSKESFEEFGTLNCRARKVEIMVDAPVKKKTRSVGTQTDPVDFAAPAVSQTNNADLAAPAVSGKKRSIASIFEKTDWEKAGHIDHRAEFERSFVLEKDRIKEKSPFMQSIYRDLGPERYPYLTSRKVFLTMQGIEVPEDYDLSLERSREFENELRRKREAEDALKVREPSMENKKPKLSQDLDCENPSES